MSLPFYVLIAAAILVILWLLPGFLRKFLHLRALRLVQCPETGRPAAVRIDAGYAALTGVAGKAALRLKECSRWPERRDCAQVCLRQIETAPVQCLVRSIVEGWYQGKSCVLCGKSIGEIQSWDHQPALMDTQRKTVEWKDVKAEELPEMFATHLPVCWDCHIVETLRRQYPELVMERAVKAQPTHRGH